MEKVIEYHVGPTLLNIEVLLFAFSILCYLLLFYFLEFIVFIDWTAETCELVSL